MAESSNVRRTGQQGVGEAGERGDIDVEHGLDLGPLGGLEEAVIAEAGVIDEEIDADAFVGEPAGEAVDGVEVGEIERVAVDAQVRIASGRVRP